MVRAAFLHLGKQVEFNGELPWKRCLKEVEYGNIDFALGVYFNEERAKIYDYSIHYTTLTPQIFYLSTKPIEIQKLSDLNHYLGCGIDGSSYAHYGLNSETIDLGNGYDSLFRKLLIHRCDYFVEELEAIYDNREGLKFLSNPLVKHGCARSKATLSPFSDSKEQPQFGNVRPNQCGTRIRHPIRSGRIDLEKSHG